jgi:leucyl aminopeptidase
MAVPLLSLTESAPDADVVVLFAVRRDGAPRLLGAVDAADPSALLAGVGCNAGKDQLVRLPAGVLRPEPVAVIGVGDAVTADALRYAAGSAEWQLKGAATIALDASGQSADEVNAVLLGAALGSYRYTEYKSEPAVSGSIESIVVVASADALGGEVAASSAVRSATVLAQASALVKDLVNTPPLDLYPETFAQRAVAATEGLPIAHRIWDEQELAADGFGGIAGVGQGSERPPRLVRLSYEPADARRHLALVGKGITFDTGGLSLKPRASMVGMQYDMAGAATVLGAIIAVAALGLPVRVTAWLCIAENMPSGSSIRPTDVLRIRGGRTVEVLNTDAEGRLVLADGLVAASEERPDAIIDVATLTGAALVALGTRYSALMGDDELVTVVRDAAAHTGEQVWPMPLPDELRATIDSDVADIANANLSTTAGGMLLAGVFLREFVGPVDAAQTRSIPWAHLDIAGTAQVTGSPFGFNGKGPTAATLRTLVEVAERLCQG